MRSFGTPAVSLPLFLASLFSMSALVDAQYRLPGTTEPIDYHVSLRASLTGGETSFPFEGRAMIGVHVKENTRTIVLHANRLQIIDVRVQDENNQPLQDTYSVSEDDRHFLEINLNTEVQAGSNLTLAVMYRGQMEDDMYGWYRSWYKEGNTKKWLASTQFQATHARRALPCYDEPGYKVPFTFSFVIPVELDILFNTRNSSVATYPGGDVKVVSFAQTPPMSSYLLAFVLSEFQTLPGDYSVWSRPDNVQQTAYAQSIMAPTLKAMVDFVGVTFEQGSIDKLDTVAVPDFSSGAMENWGLVTYREQRIQWEEGVSSERNKQSLASVVAHEIAHQWFGDLVSPAWWSYLWLNEGFATYFEFFACHQVEEKWRMDEQFVVSSVQDALRADGLLSANPLTHDVDSPSSISAKFDTISYEKGGSVIRMMELLLGTDIFLYGLNKYMNRHQYGAATDDDLFAEMEAAVSELEVKPFLPDGVSVREVMHTWVRQAGYPVITVTRNYEQNTVYFTQRRFLYTETGDQLSWYVPLTMTWKSESNFTTDTKLWLTPEGPAQITYNATEDDWILVNIKQSGFYRVNYDVENWRLIAQQLEKSPPVIPPVMRAQLVDDALNLARGGVISYATALDMTRFLKNELDFIPWASALSAFSFLDGRLHGSDTYPLFQKYLRLLLENVAGELGYVEPTEKPDDYHVRNLHRNQIATWACNLGVKNCLDEAKAQFQAYVSGSENSSVAPDMKSVVYCHGLLQGSQEDWAFLWNKYLNTTTSTEQSTILTALGCSNNRDILNEYLSKSIANNDEIRRQDALTVFSSTYSRPIGLEVALQFVGQNLDKIVTQYGGLNVVRSVVSGIASRLSTNDQIRTVETAFVNMNLADPTLNATVVSALESAKKNVEWTERNRAAIHDWLKKEVGASSVATLSVLLLAACFVGLAAL